MGGLQNQLMSISELDELIGFATLTSTIDDYGAAVDSYSVPSQNIRAKVRYINTHEAELALKQEKTTTEIKIHLRYDSTYTQYKYVYWNSKYFDIYAIEDTPRQRFHVIKARLIET